MFVLVCLYACVQTCMESALMISIGNCEARSMARRDFPEPVAPIITTTFGLEFEIFGFSSSFGFGMPLGSLQLSLSISRSPSLLRGGRRRWVERYQEDRTPPQSFSLLLWRPYSFEAFLIIPISLWTEHITNELFCSFVQFVQLNERIVLFMFVPYE